MSNCLTATQPVHNTGFYQRLLLSILCQLLSLRWLIPKDTGVCLLLCKVLISYCTLSLSAFK